MDVDWDNNSPPPLQYPPRIPDKDIYSEDDNDDNDLERSGDEKENETDANGPPPPEPAIRSWRSSEDESDDDGLTPDERMSEDWELEVLDASMCILHREFCPILT